MIPTPTHEVRRPSPEHQSIFTDTYQGVPNPQIPHLHPYPTRFHGPVYGVPRFGLPYRPSPWQVPTGLPGSPSGGCMSCDGFGVDASASVDLNASVSIGGGKVTTKGELVKAIVEILEKRAGTTLSTDVKGYLNLQITMTSRAFTAALAVLGAYGFEQKQDFAAASREWTKARGWMNTSYNFGSVKSDRMKSAASWVSWLFDRFAAEDAAGGPKRRLTLSKVGPTVLSLISTNPQPVPAPPYSKALTIESNMTPWLILGGVVVAGTAGYFIWKKRKTA